ncbi:MAG: hypothetical protein PHO07_15740 [Pirellulales bacterium]|nr:hypothetical protein [Thermoguttaceae bacterium]MDD4788627.1 hypothetical protein [Pirellulales bacterium]NLZ00444.1 hypothetical protein [Pirellulaceae bacterium]
MASAYRLVYRRYLAKGYVRARPGGIVYQPRFGLGTSRTLVAIDPQQGVVGALTVVGDNPLGLQLEEICRREAEQLRGEGRHLAEVTCLSIDAAGRIPGKLVFLALTRFLFQHSYLRGYDDLLLAIHPRHYRVYWHAFRAFPIGPCREYGAVCGNPALCCRIDMHDLKANMTASMRQAYFENLRPEEDYDGPPVGRADHEEFCRMLEISSSIPGCDTTGDRTLAA